MADMECFACGARLPIGSQHCDHCGEATDMMRYSRLSDGTPFASMDVITIGRTKDNDIQVARPYISRRHATLRRVEQGYRVVDNKTLAGTYINGKPIHGSAIAKPGDYIGIGTCDFHVQDDLVLLKRDLEGKLYVEGWDLTYRVPGHGGPKEILRDASIVAQPGELVAILGPSGCGKTTLLNSLIRNLQVDKTYRKEGQHVPALEGGTWINTIPLSSSYHAFMRLIGFVPQDDLVHYELSAIEALRYTQELRLPADHSKEEIDERIRSVLKSLELPENIDRKSVV